MSNPYFRFKQFVVHHDKCAMKVGTDGVLLGAWSSVANAKSILDVGTGAGLIAMMIAQRNPCARIMAVDIDMDAVKQAKENVINSPFSGRIDVELIDFRIFAKSRQERFDLIVSNPPYFSNSFFCRPTPTGQQQGILFQCRWRICWSRERGALIKTELSQ